MATRIERIVAGLLALDDLERSRDYKKNMAVAADPQDMTKKIEALRKTFKEQSLQVSYESKQKLAGLLREISHVLTDLIHAMNVNGEDASAMQKLQRQVGNVTKSLSFVGEDDADGDGIKDDIADEANIDLGKGKSTEDSHEAFKSAVKSIAPEKSEKSKDPASEPKPSAPEKKEEKPEKSGEEHDEDAGEDTKSVKPEAKKIVKKIPPKKKSKPEAKETKDESDKADTDDKGSDEGGFVSGLLAESSFKVTAGFRFAYLGLKPVKKSGEKFDVVCAGFGSHDADNFKVYYYRPTVKFFKGNAIKADKVFRKILEADEGYSKLSWELNSLVKSGHLEVVSKKEVAAASVLKDSETSWSYNGIGEHPKNANKQALWFEIGALEFAAIPSKNFESGDIAEVDAYIKTNIIGSKTKGTAGKSYESGLRALEALVDSGKLKVIFHSGI